MICLIEINTDINAQTCWYVDNAAIGLNNGSSWDNAWPGFAYIQWNTVQPGDILYISGGTTEKTYYERLSIVASGTEENPIIIKVGHEPGHAGNVIITNDGPLGGISIIYRDYITIDGNRNGERKLIVQNCTVPGIKVYGAYGIKLSHLEIHHNGDEVDWDNSGITFTATGYVEPRPNLEICYCHIHHNWQDAISGFGPIASGFGYISIHDNEISDVVDDGFECGSGGVDFYNNSMHDRSYDGGDGHPDGVAFNGAEYYRVYNNRFYNFRRGTAYINYEPFYNTSPPSPRPGDHVYIYNNLIYEEEIIPTGFIPSHYTFYTPNPYRSGRPDGIYTDIDSARALFHHMIEQDYIGTDSYILDNFRNLPDYVDMELDPIYENHQQEIYQIVVSYEDVGSSLGGISFGGSDITTTYLSDIIIANNVMVNLPARGFGISCNNHDSENLNNIIVANNIALNCYTNGGGIASSVGGISDNSLIGSYGSDAKIVYDNNIIFQGNQGCSAMRYNDHFIDHYEDFVTIYGLNVHGANIDPSLNGDYKPYSQSSPAVDNGINLSAIFTTDIDCGLRPYGSGWDIGAYEFGSSPGNIVSVKIKVFMEGPFNIGSMNTDLQTGGHLPLQSPYDDTEVSAIPENVVDWVQVELRIMADESGDNYTKSVFLRNDGMVIDQDGSDTVSIEAPEGDYFIVVRHRNHLTVMSNVAIHLTSEL
ncbi:hypothetical protein JW835_00560 [bacterium]|nr:hypothetical protein [bacterium]